MTALLLEARSCAPRSRASRLTALALTQAVLVAIALALGAFAAARDNAERPGRAPVHAGLASLPTAARAPISAALGSDLRGYDIAGMKARNPAQKLGVSFTRGGASVTVRQMHVVLGLLAWGRPGALTPARRAAPRALANRVYYAYPGVREWYTNGPLGLEQGFEVTRRPQLGGGPLTLALALGGNTRARLVGAGALTLSGVSGALRYGALEASDARGRRLHAWLTLSGGRLEIHVKDRSAAYPVRIDPLLASARVSGLHRATLAPLSAGNGSEGDQFGFGLAISANTIVVGAPGRAVNGNTGQGALYVFKKPASGWASAKQSAELTLSGGHANEYLGSSIAISGKEIVAGAEGRGGHEGVLYVFTAPATGWAGRVVQTAELTASDGAPEDRFGTAVAISGATIVAGADTHRVGGHAGQGALYVFTEPRSGWRNATQTAELTASNGATNSHLGFSVAASGATIVGGSLAQRVGSHPRQGAVYVFERPQSGWTDATQTAELTASDGRTHDNLGYAVAASQRTIVASAPLHAVGANVEQGVVYVFSEPPAGWRNGTQRAELRAADGRAYDHFGWGVAVAGPTIVVGAPRHMVGTHAKQGALYVFTVPAGHSVGAIEAAELTARHGEAQARLGWVVGASAATLVGGAPYTSVDGDFAAGAIYVSSGSNR